MTSETTRRNQTQWTLTTYAKAKAKAQKGKGAKGKGPRAKPEKQNKECYVCGKTGHLARDRWSRANKNRTVNEVEGAKVDSDARKSSCLRLRTLPTWLRNSRRWFGDVRQRSLSQQHLSHPVLENRFFRYQTDQFNSEVQTEEHSKITESVKSGQRSETT